MIPLFLPKVSIPIDKPFRNQAYWNRREQIYCRMQLDEHGGQADHNDCKNHKASPNRMCGFFFRPNGGNSQRIGYMQRRTYAGIGIKGIQKVNTSGQKIIIYKFFRTQILPCGI